MIDLDAEPKTFDDPRFAHEASKTTTTTYAFRYGSETVELVVAGEPDGDRWRCILSMILGVTTQGGAVDAITTTEQRLEYR